MASSAAFRDYALDLLAPLGGVSARAMFGGFGLYRGGVIFALIADDTLYLKAGGALQAEFEAAGMDRFRPRVRGKPFPMPYFAPEPDMIEDSEKLLAFAHKALAAAGAPRGPRAKPPRGRRTGR